MSKRETSLSPADISRIIEMAWEDHTPFEAIYSQYQLDEGACIKLMRREMKPSSFRMWRKRVSGRASKHQMRAPEGFIKHKAYAQNKLSSGTKKK